VRGNRKKGTEEEVGRKHEKHPLEETRGKVSSRKKGISLVNLVWRAMVVSKEAILLSII